MLQNIIRADINNKKKYYANNNLFKTKKTVKKATSITDNSTQTSNPIMCDKSTSTEDLVKKEKERKLLEKFKKETLKKQQQADLFKQVLGTPRNIQEIEDE